MTDHILRNRQELNLERFQEITGINPAQVSNNWTWKNGLFRSELVIPLTELEHEYILNARNTPHLTETELQQQFTNIGASVQAAYEQFQQQMLNALAKLKESQSTE